MRIAFAIVALFFSRMLVAAWFYPGNDADLGWQSWLGSRILSQHHIPSRLGTETFTSTGSPWVAQEWAFSTAVAWSYAHHAYPWLALLTALAAAAAILIVGYRAKRRGASTIAIALVTVCTGAAMLQAFGARAQIFGWLCLSLLLLVLDAESPWAYLAIPIVAVWANLHASAVLAPVLVGAWALGTLIEDRAWTPRVARNMLTAAGCVLAICMTPLLGELPRYALSLQTSPIRSTIAEWQPSDIVDFALYGGALPLIALCAYFGIAAPRERWRDGMLFALTAPMAFMAMRHVPICAITIAPMAASRLSSVLGPYARVNVVLNESISRAAIGFAAIACSAAIALNLLHVPAISGAKLPRQAMTALAGVRGTHNLYCEDFAWCSLALPHRNVRTFVDGRCDPFPKQVWDDYVAIEHLRPQWRAILEHYNVNAILARPGRPLAQALALQPGWRSIYKRGGYQIFLRGGIRTARS
ncbi:MAG: hypothetical protein ABR508_00135 [Candidatus Baltobacteraceae bacterium]